MLDKLMNALDSANVEAALLALPSAEFEMATTALLRTWNCHRQDVIGKALQKMGAGTISARHLPSNSETNESLIEVSFSTVLGGTRKTVFCSQRWTHEGQEYCLLIGKNTNAGKSEIDYQNEKRLNLALRSGGYARWDYDYETNTTTNSPEMYEIFGSAAGSDALNFHSFNALIHPEDQDKTIEEKIAKAPFGTDMFQTRYRVKSASGAYIWIESLAGVLRDPISAKPVKVVGLCRNIDEHMLAMERLKNSERNLKRTQRAAKLGSFTLRIDSNVSRLSAEMAALIGMADAMVHPTLNTFIKMIEPGDRERFTEALELAKLGRVIKNIEIAVKTNSGEVVHFEVSIEPDVDATGKIVAVFGCCQNVGERKALEKRFQQAQKMEAVGQLTGGIAHDFNNLLMVVMGNLQLVEQLVKSDERATKRIRAAMDAAEKGSDLTRRMLAFSRQQTLQNKELEVNELIFKMEDMLKQALTAIVTLKIIPGENLWPIRADKTMLETAILNLAINARDAMQPKGGDLIIETSNRTLDQNYCANHEDLVPGDYIEIAVTDTGSGIAAENIEKVFQPFFTTKGPEKGSGLGLSMIYGFVKQSNGHIKIYSEVGHGTTVKIYLPRRKSQDDTANLAKPADLQAQIRQELGQPLAPPPEVTQIRKKLILVVEDNPSVRDVAAAMIEEMGYDVITAENGHEGLKAITERQDIDLVISDVIMAGGMNGPELAAKAVKHRPNLRILFMSGYAPGSVRQMQDLPDTIELVNKPFTRNDLSEKVRKALAA